VQVTDVETYTLHVPIDGTVGDSRLEITDVYWVVIELETDAGHTGVGWMGSLGFAPDLLERFVDSQFADALVGADPFAHEAIREELRTRTIYYGELGMSAWPRGAIDVALWDLKAKAAGVPLYRLLGGAESTVPAYVSSMDVGTDLEELAALHGGYAGEGFTAFKTKAGNRTPEAEAARIEEIRRAIGPDADLFVDANQAWTVKEAVRTVEAMAEHGVDWMEEPVSEFDLAGHARVAERIDPPLATGEMLYRPVQFERLLERGGMEVAQPDLIRNGGVTGMTAVADLAGGPRRSAGATLLLRDQRPRGGRRADRLDRRVRPRVRRRPGTGGPSDSRRRRGPPPGPSRPRLPDRPRGEGRAARGLRLITTTCSVTRHIARSLVPCLLDGLS